MFQITKPLTAALFALLLLCSCITKVYEPPRRIAEVITSQHIIMDSFVDELRANNLTDDQIRKILLTDAKAWNHLQGWVERTTGAGQ